MVEASVSVVVPAYNEAGRIGDVIARFEEGYELLVIDDGSSDGTVPEAREAGARVVEQSENRGYIPALQRGFREASREVVVTFDADGEHRVTDVPRVARPVLEGEKDVVFGARETIPRPSERLLNRLATLRVDVSDTGTGLRALRTDLARSLALDTACTCGTFALEANSRGARVGEVPIVTEDIDKPKRIAWEHGRQFFHVLRYLLLAD